MDKLTKQPSRNPEQARSGTIGVKDWFRPYVFPSIALSIIVFFLIAWVIWIKILN